jgi:hypothetical protein
MTLKLRRDRCYFVGLRSGKLTSRQASRAWQSLARELEALGEKDVPKFHDLLHAIRAATIQAKSNDPH